MIFHSNSARAFQLKSFYKHSFAVRWVSVFEWGILLHMALSYTQKIELKPPTDDDGNDSDAFIMNALYCNAWIFFIKYSNVNKRYIFKFQEHFVKFNKFSNGKKKDKYARQKCIHKLHSKRHIITNECMWLWIAALQCASMRTIIIIVIISLVGRSVDATNLITSKIQTTINTFAHVERNSVTVDDSSSYDVLKVLSLSFEFIEYRSIRSEIHHHFVFQLVC